MRSSLALAAMLAATPLSAQTTPADNYWVEVPPEGAIGDGNGSAPAKVEFWDKLQEKAFDEFCRLVEIPVSQDFSFGENAATAVGFKRYLRRLPTGNFAVIDEAKLGLSLGWGRALADMAGTPLTLSFGARLEGQSYVMRPTESKKSCQEIDRILKVWDTKTTIPFSGSRISNMMVGELWRLPLTLTLSGALGAGKEVVSALPISLSIGSSAQGRTSVSLYRLSESQVRFRLRLDEAVVYDAGGGAVATIATYQFGLPAGESVLMKFVNRELSRQLNRYIAASLNFNGSTRKGVNSVLEFTLDPRDEEQMKKLSQVLKGDLGLIDELGRMAREAKNNLTSEAAARENLVDLSETHEAALGAPASFAGMDDYERKNKGWRFRLPLLFDFGGSSSKDRDHITLLDDAGGEYDIYRSMKRKENGFLDIPFLGQIFKDHRERSAQVFTYRDAAGKVQEPVAVYVEQRGFLRAGEGRATELARDSDELFQLAGTRGRGRNAKGSLPLSKIIPPPLPPDDEGRVPERFYERGVSALTLGFNQKAINDVFFAGKDTILRAYANTLSPMVARMMEWVIENGSWVGEKIEYDASKLLYAMGFDWRTDQDAESSARAEIRSAVNTALEIVADLAKAKLSPTPEERAKAFLGILSGSGESGLKYEEILRVIIQLVDPSDLSGEFFTYTARKGSGKSKDEVKLRVALHGNKQDPLLDAAMRTKNRFVEPSTLQD